MSEVTRMLDSVAQGDPKAAEELLPLVYDELRRLAAAELIKLRFFAGFTQQQAAELLGSNKRAADRLWSFARAFLLKEIQAAQGGGG